ncbi:putative oxidoreductase, nitronate monooxygenase family [Candidatus Syntrophocurvum alkaliphilum]|uniref:Probable nitronate monooxygenase n=1 Tax=Candidatus Syntrophocurvum alkaliphilum TaxID=2293317 RepID=A0A6I6D7X0_9FIRM|nr:nitronate monooxygenase [Candidatus Syntrophocurvum alkaliphilum]QGT98717.1 putative oxidoreductase, nitronate monooxygenase family [Candidatus Syntrophocurvum alkaliphilum]
MNFLEGLKIGDIKTKIPIVQGGMGVGISLSGLASAVAKEGGIGVIAAAGIGMLEPDGHSNYIEASIRRLRSEIRKAREISDGVIGVNIMVALSNFSDMVKTSIEEEVDVIFAGGGLPLTLPQYLKGSTGKTKLVPIISTARVASLICKRWVEKYDYLPDAIVVEGPEAGGHLGFKQEEIDNPNYSLEKLVPEVVKDVKNYEEKYNKSIPVIAAGGIYSGEDIAKVLQLGASGVQMATRFVTTHECDAATEFKEAYINSTENDTVIIKSPVGMPGRALTNKFIEDVNKGVKTPFKCPYHCIKTCDYQNSPYCIAITLINAQRGKFKYGFAFAGKNAYKTNEIISVKELMENLVSEYKNAVSQ